MPQIETPLFLVLIWQGCISFRIVRLEQKSVYPCPILFICIYVSEYSKNIYRISSPMIGGIVIRVVT